MKQAIVAVEDRRFWEHQGVDVQGMARAVWADLRSQDFVQGGSTITQQFVKNTVHAAGADGQPQAQGGRARLAARAALVEGSDPDRLPEHDLLRERRLRDRDGLARLLRQARVASSRCRRPRSSPASRPARAPTTRPTNPKAAKARRTTVLGLMLEQGLITRPTTASADESPLPSPRRSACRDRKGPAGYFAEYVKQQLVPYYGSGDGLRRRAQDLHVDRPRAAEARARGDRQVARRRATGPAPRSSRSTRATAGSSPWSAARASRRASSTSPSRASGRPDRRSSRSSSTTALEQGISPQTVVHLRADRHQPRRQALVGQQLRGLVPRADRPRTRRRSTPTTRSTRS